MFPLQTPSCATSRLLLGLVGNGLVIHLTSARFPLISLKTFMGCHVMPLLYPEACSCLMLLPSQAGQPGGSPHCKWPALRPVRSGSSCTPASSGRDNQLPIQVAEPVTSWALLLQNVLHCRLLSAHSCCSTPSSVMKEARNASAFWATSALPTAWGLSAALPFLALPTFSSCSLSPSFPACRYGPVPFAGLSGAAQPVTSCASLHAGTAAGCKAGDREVMTRGEQLNRQTMLAAVCHRPLMHGSRSAKKLWRFRQQSLSRPALGRSDQDMAGALQRPEL